ncbi:MAG: aminotransferase class I/II-fold pyridoxal phosphate-dependent enzyme [Rickettsiales bacterium]|nr:aminotransferase class I/II-fold pyridoxal phosphate-dependent enzyme [Rickettsiales bacterium]
MMLNSHANNLSSKDKKDIFELALFGGEPLFSKIKSTSNLFRPKESDFFKYAKTIFETRRLSNNGELVQLMERRLCEIHQVNNCIAVCNGLWALVMTLKSIALEGKSEVIMPSLTYRRMADVTAWVKLTPNFCDVNKNTLGISRQNVEPLINNNTAAIIAAHPMVNLSDITSLVELAKEKNIPLLFDSVEAAYASYNGKMLGSFGRAEIYSMHASKFLNGFEAGYITTNDDDLAKNLRIMRGFGFNNPDNVEMLGLNAKLNELHAAMALASLDSIDSQIEKNKLRYLLYKSELSKVKGLELVNYDESEKRSYKTILIKLNQDWGISRDDTIKLMHKENMLVRPYYCPPLHTKKTHYKVIFDSLPNTEIMKDEYILMPCGEFVSEDDIIKIVNFLNFVSDNSKEIKSKL